MTADGAAGCVPCRCSRQRRGRLARRRACLPLRRIDAIRRHVLAVPALQPLRLHADALHDLGRVQVLRVADGEQLLLAARPEREVRDGDRRLARVATPPAIAAQAPADLERAVVVRQRRRLAAQVLQAAGADELTGLALDERPPRVAQVAPARLDALDDRDRLRARLGLAGQVAHDFGVGVQRVQALDVVVAIGLQAQARGRQRAHRARRVARANAPTPARPANSSAAFAGSGTAAAENTRRLTRLDT